MVELGVLVQFLLAYLHTFNRVRCTVVYTIVCSFDYNNTGTAADAFGRDSTSFSAA